MRLRPIMLLALVALGVPAIPQTTFNRYGMRDYDQRRDALPNNGGMHCVPASYTNLFYYMAANGMPNMDSGFGTGYNDVTALMLLTGLGMGTGDNGTNFDNAWDYATAYVNSSTSLLVFHWGYGPDWNWGINKIRNAIRVGGIVRIGYGRYAFNVNHGDWDRYNGHAVVVSGYDWTTSQRKFVVNDPATDDGDIDAQGAFTFEVKNTSNITLTTHDHGVVTHARYTGWTGDFNDRRAVVDSMHQIVPMFAGWPVGGRNTEIITKIPWHFQDTDVSPQPPSEIRYRTVTPAAAWCYDIGEPSFYYATSGGQIIYVDALDRTETAIGTVLGEPMDMVIGGTSMDLYILSREDEQDRITMIELDTLAQVSRPTPGWMAKLDFDSISDGPAVLDFDGKTIFTYSADLNTIRRQALRTLSVNQPAPGGFTNWHFKIDHNTGDALIAANGSDVITRYPRSGSYRAGIPKKMVGVTNISSLMPLDKRLIAVQDGFSLKTYDWSGNAVVTQFTNLTVAGPFKMPRSMYAVPRGTLVGPTWADVLPEGIDP